MRTGHYEGCWKDHWPCLTEKLLDHIGRMQPVETDEPPMMGAGGGLPPMPTALEAIEAHVRQIQILCDETGRDPTEWLSDNAAQGETGDRTQLHGALVRIVMEAEGCPPACSHEFHKLAIASVIKIGKDALTRVRPVEPSEANSLKCVSAGCQNNCEKGNPYLCSEHARSSEKSTVPPVAKVFADADNNGRDARVLVPPEKAPAPPCGNPVMINADRYRGCRLPSGHDGKCSAQKASGPLCAVCDHIEEIHTLGKSTHAFAPLGSVSRADTTKFGGSRSALPDDDLPEKASCVCGNPSAPGIAHRTKGPCFWIEENGTERA
jgi:hypothetical protein